MRQRRHGSRAVGGAGVSSLTLRRLTIEVLSCSLAILVLCACSCKQTEPPQTSGSVTHSTTPPFKTKEPTTYQAVRSITFVPANGGQTVVSTIAIFRDGEARREENNSENKRVVYLDLPTGHFMLLPDERVYAPVEDGPTARLDSDGSADLYLHTAPIQSSYENLGSEIVNGQNASKYKVTVNDASGRGVTESETMIWIDESIGMPVKSVTRSAAGTRTMELTRINLTVDKRIFEIPKDYRKIEPAALRDRLR